MSKLSKSVTPVLAVAVAAFLSSVACSGAWANACNPAIAQECSPDLR
jgi:hypothetical protein